MGKNNNEYIGAGRTEEVQEESDVIIRNEIEFPADETKRSVAGVKHVAIGISAAFGSFLFACWLLSSFDISYILKSFVALIFSILVIKAYDKATGEMPTPKNGAVTNFTIILFVLCLFTGYQNAQGKSAGAFFDTIFFAQMTPAEIESVPEEEKFSSESGTVKSVGDIWFASHIFSKGDVVKIEVEYNAVQMVGGRILEPGIYENETINSNGQIMFEGVSMNPTKITITY